MVTLRHFSPEDVEFLQKSMYPDMTSSEITEMIAEWNSCVCQGRCFEMFAILSDQRIVGSVSLYEHSRSVASAGIEILETERKKGFASETLTLLSKHAAEKGYRVLLDQIRADNQASIRLHEKLGFESDGYVYRNQRGHEVVLYLKVLKTYRRQP